MTLLHASLTLGQPGDLSTLEDDTGDTWENKGHKGHVAERGWSGVSCGASLALSHVSVHPRSVLSLNSVYDCPFSRPHTPWGQGPHHGASMSWAQLRVGSNDVCWLEGEGVAKRGQGWGAWALQGSAGLSVTNTQLRVQVSGHDLGCLGRF